MSAEIDRGLWPDRLTFPIQRKSSLEDCCDSIVREFLICHQNYSLLSFKMGAKKYAGLILYNSDDLGFMEKMRTELLTKLETLSEEHFKILEFPENAKVELIFGEERYMGVNVREFIDRGLVQYNSSQQF